MVNKYTYYESKLTYKTLTRKVQIEEGRWRRISPCVKHIDANPTPDLQDATPNVITKLLSTNNGGDGNGVKSSQNHT